MATVYSIQKTIWDQDDPSDFVDPNTNGKVRVAYGEYEASSLSASDVIEMFNLPDNARVVGGYLYNDALGASTTLSVGHGAYNNADGTAVSLDADEFLAASSTSSAGRNDIAVTLALGGGSVVDADKDGYPVTVTLAGASATGTIALMMFYVVE